jgi:hypothetical protein
MWAAVILGLMVPYSFLSKDACLLVESISPVNPSFGFGGIGAFALCHSILLQFYKFVQQCIYLYNTMTMYADKNPPR